MKRTREKRKQMMNMKSKLKRRKQVSGVITVEMSLILPLILLIIIAIVNLILYFHDKNIMQGAVIETAVIGAQMERKPDEKGTVNLEELYQQRVNGKLIIVGNSEVTYEVTQKEIQVVANSTKGWVKLKVQHKEPILHPEKKIRLKQILGDQFQPNQKEESDGEGTSD